MTATKVATKEGHRLGHAEKIVFQSSAMLLWQKQAKNPTDALCASPQTTASPAPTSGPSFGTLPDSPHPNPTQLIKCLIFNPVMLSSRRGGKS